MPVSVRQIDPSYRDTAELAQRAPMETPPSGAVRVAGRPASAAQEIARLLFILSSLVALAVGWWLSSHETFTPKEGAGYWIGIAGGTTLLIQLAYPLRKRVRFMRRLGSAPTWFRLHMVLGIVGPLLILYHSSYSLGAPNSNVALTAMLVVAVSGIIGRYFYGKVHNGLYGAHANLQDLLEDATSLLSVIEHNTGGTGGAVAARLTSFGERMLTPSRSVFAALGKVLWLSFAMPFARQNVLRAVHEAIEHNAPRMNWSNRDRRAHYAAAKPHVHAYFDAVSKASGLAFYDRLFSMWHLLHMPLYFLLIVTGIIHVISVHLY